MSHSFILTILIYDEHFPTMLSLPSILKTSTKPTALTDDGLSLYFPYNAV